MRPVVLIAVVVASATAGLLVASAADDQSTPPPPSPVGRDAAGPGPAPPSLVGQPVRVYFRRSDDLPFAEPAEGQVRVNLNAKLTHVSGKVLEVQSGWIILDHRQRPGRPALWIPSTSVGYIMVDEAADRDPAMQP